MKASKKIVGATAALVAAVALSAGSTFAWFTSNSNVKINTIETNVVVQGGDLRIAYVDNGTIGTYGYEVTVPGALYASTVLDAVTSDDGISFAGAPYEVEDTVNGGTKTENKTVTANKEYIEFTVAFISNTNMKVYLDASASVEKGNHVSDNTEDMNQITAWQGFDPTDYTGDTTYTGIAAGNKIPTNAIYASRVSFKDDAEDTKAKIWAPYEDTAGGGNTSTAKGWYLGNLAADYLAGNTTPTASQFIYDSDNVDIIKPATAADAGGEISYTDDNLLITLEAGKATKVTIRLWIEGNDGDCFNSIYGQGVKLTLDFHGIDVVDTSSAGTT